MNILKPDKKICDHQETVKPGNKKQLIFYKHLIKNLF